MGDKILHVAACAAVTLLAARLLPPAFSYPAKAALGALAGLTVGALKEALDYGGFLPGAADAMDGLADAAGVVFALVLMVALRRRAAAAGLTREILVPQRKEDLPPV